MIRLSQEHLQTIRTHAESTYPDECCGIILGYLASESKIVVEVMPIENAWNTEGAAKFLGESTAESKRHRLYAWQGYSYIIVTVQNRKAGELRNWSLDDRHQFQAEAIENIKSDLV
ncbi:MAG: Mov34/MPN/PAD-1 family protein [Nostoc sp.]|uniref:Mov34/MPN/PAD-1 family protein n=1 Tax=Nostoc sp. TaxID=1180 RepID=UPI002FFCE6A3